MNCKNTLTFHYFKWTFAFILYEQVQTFCIHSKQLQLGDLSKHSTKILEAILHNLMYVMNYLKSLFKLFSNLTIMQHQWNYCHIELFICFLTLVEDISQRSFRRCKATTFFNQYHTPLTVSLTSVTKKISSISS